MVEPQDHRHTLPWRAVGGHIWALPTEEGASPIAVTSDAMSPPALAEHIVTLHNADVHAATQLPLDASAAADAYMAEQWPTHTPADPVGLERVRDGYVDGYKTGWQEGVHVSAEEAENDLKMIRSLQSQVNAAYARAEAQEQRAQDLAEGRNAAAARVGELENEKAKAVRYAQDAEAAWRASQRVVEQVRAELGTTHAANVRLKESLAKLSERFQDLEHEHSDLLDDARIVASLSSAPGARQAAAERIRKMSPAVQDHLDEFEQEVAGKPVSERLELPEVTVRRGGIQFPTPDPSDDYDKGVPLHGAGHHIPSYAEGYRNGRNDTQQGYREPLETRDQALYAAHLLLAESVAAHEGTRTQWQKAVRRWQDEYVNVFGDGDAA